MKCFSFKLEKEKNVSNWVSLQIRHLLFVLSSFLVLLQFQFFKIDICNKLCELQLSRGRFEYLTLVFRRLVLKLVQHFAKNNQFSGQLNQQTVK